MLKVLAILIAVLGANGYGFSSLAYNTYLFDGLDPLNNYMTLSRHRRDLESETGTEKQGVCCTGDIIAHPKMYRKMRKVLADCPLPEPNLNDSANGEINCEEMRRMKDILICDSECLATGLKLIDENGKLNRENIIKFWNEHEVGDIEWKKAALEEYVDNCMSKAEAKEKQNDKQCSNLAATLNFCIKAKFLTGCPADLRVVSEACTLQRYHSTLMKF